MSPQRPGEGIYVDPSWPGLETADGQLRADPDVMAQLGRRLTAQARSLGTDASHLPSGVSYLDDYRRSTTTGLESSVSVPDEDHWFGRWPTAGDMEHGWRTARWSILRYYTRLVEQLDAAGRTLEQTAAAYESGEAANQAELDATAPWQAGDTLARAATPAVGRAVAGLMQESTQVPGIRICEAVHDYDPQWILDEIDHLRTRRPWIDMSTAASSLRATSDRLHHLHDWIRHQATTLAQAWCSPAATACQQALRRLAGTATHLADRSAELGEFTSRSADTIATAIAGFPTLEGRSFTEWVQDTLTLGADPNRERRQHEIRDALARLNQAYTDINHTTLPTRVDAELPVLRPGGDDPEPPPPPVLLPPAQADAMSDTGGSDATDVRATAVETESRGGLPAGVIGSTGGLAGATPAPLAGPQPSPVIGGGAVPASGGSPMGPGSAPGGNAVPGGVLPGPGGRTGGVPGPGPAGGVRGAPGATGRVPGPGVMAAPMGGTTGQTGSATRRGGRAGLVGGPLAGTGVRSREGETIGGADDWLVEDERPWEGEPDVPPEVIK